MKEEPKPMSVEEYIETVVHQAMYATIDNLCAPLLSILNKLAKYDVGDGLLHTIKMLVSECVCLVYLCKDRHLSGSCGIKLVKLI